jgi:predicted transcriptional regulator
VCSEEYLEGHCSFYLWERATKPRIKNPESLSNFKKILKTLNPETLKKHQKPSTP